jgi:hypothetical protein
LEEIVQNISPVKINIKINNNDPYGFKKNKPFKGSLLVIGLILFLLGGAGFIIDLFFPTFSNSYHFIAGKSNGVRLFTGSLLLFTFYLLRNEKNPKSQQ